MGAHLSEEDIKTIGKNMTRDSLKKGIIFCFVIYMGVRILLMF